MRALDLTGNRFGMLVALFKRGRRGSQALWRCLCDCGQRTTVQLGNLRNGHTTSCGCKRSIITTALKTTHGYCGTQSYSSWQAMLERCLNPLNPKFDDYGGRGINVCKRWRNFENFLADMGERPIKTTLGRIDNDGPYKARNCRWETAMTQGRNKRNTRTFVYEGIAATVAEHCERLGLNCSTVRSRIYTYGWTISKSFSTNQQTT